MSKRIKRTVFTTILCVALLLAGCGGGAAAAAEAPAAVSETDSSSAVTDDCGVVEALGKVVFLVEGDEENLKITTPMDLILAEAILRDREDRA